MYTQSCNRKYSTLSPQKTLVSYLSFNILHTHTLTHTHTHTHTHNLPREQPIFPFLLLSLDGQRESGRERERDREGERGRRGEEWRVWESSQESQRGTEGGLQREH